MSEQLIKDIKRGLLQNIDEKRYTHTMGVVESAIYLAKRYNEDYLNAEIAALMHDFAKGFNRQELMDYINKYNIKPDTIMTNAHELLHGEVAAIIGEKRFNINNTDILNAIKYHTTGRMNMSKLEKIIYLSDFIEKGRNYPGVDKLRKIADDDLDKGVLQSLDNTIIYVISIEKPLHPNTLAARNQMLLSMNK
ncbi:MAG: bis(5'-nucleosyl)-tetraphosphatase (symmetrical) YqeK [Clostridiaceae bacterium]|nr:bis(5'-nucleosyl)-tetraphosphatase (symmetrical) YqeK [Clostridiaceae bacterium]